MEAKRGHRPDTDPYAGNKVSGVDVKCPELIPGPRQVSQRGRVYASVGAARHCPRPALIVAPLSRARLCLCLRSWVGLGLALPRRCRLRHLIHFSCLLFHLLILRWPPPPLLSSLFFTLSLFLVFLYILIVSLSSTLFLLFHFLYLLFSLFLLVFNLLLLRLVFSPSLYFFSFPPSLPPPSIGS